ncbi:ABC transporter ATP-binding protein [Cyanobium gracile UHCC 0139]|uniref:ABC transporter ATP-binding protein n=1 Tax=Cyanobium gracile UHCC 0139 TaxID=3110308 RepID=A0ABU5RTL3_9CYAN|nr:ABC transporter ATP-binding protein [Cyanobium gracile]MEA5391093.1 ABC transporter ATP-binding protein [Cyanobium gracile UHCC 0139]
MPDASPASAIELRGLSKRFQEGESERTVLQAVDLTIAPGQFVVLLGQSGSGKSTLLHLIGGIDTPSSGCVAIGGVDLTALDERDRTLFRRDHIGFIFQFFNLIPTLSVLENVTLPGELAGRPRAALETAAHDLLGRVGLADRASTRPDRLSGGQQQRVAIARALLHQPLLILADEPTGNLDEHTGEQVLQLLIDLTRQQGRTLIMATHNGAIAGRADRVLRVQEGHLLEASAPAAAVPA